MPYLWTTTISKWHSNDIGQTYWFLKCCGMEVEHRRSWEFKVVVQRGVLWVAWAGGCAKNWFKLLVLFEAAGRRCGNNLVEEAGREGDENLYRWWAPRLAFHNGRLFLPLYYCWKVRRRGRNSPSRVHQQPWMRTMTCASWGPLFWNRIVRCRMEKTIHATFISVSSTLLQTDRYSEIDSWLRTHVMMSRNSLINFCCLQSAQPLSQLLDWIEEKHGADVFV